jgi:hypothetical protein
MLMICLSYAMTRKIINICLSYNLDPFPSTGIRLKINSFNSDRKIELIPRS